ncbi:hypothetical protein AVEN_123930-1, partial [Araneus ventricosus]
ADSSIRDYSGKRPLHYLPKGQAERKTEIPIAPAWQMKSFRFKRKFVYRNLHESMPVKRDISKISHEPTPVKKDIPKISCEFMPSKQDISRISNESIPVKVRIVNSLCLNIGE